MTTEQETPRPLSQHCTSKNRTSLNTIGVILLLMALNTYIESLLTHIRKIQSTQLLGNIYDR